MTKATDILEARLEKLTHVGEIGWVFYLVMLLLVGAVVEIHPLENDYFNTLIDVPPALIGELRARGIALTDHFAAVLAWSYIPTFSYVLFSMLIPITCALAAARGRWLLFFTTLIAMLVPSSFFGIGSPLGGVPLFVSFMAIARCVIKGEFSMILPVAIIGIVVWGGTSSIHRLSKLGIIELADKGDANDSQRLLEIETALQALPPQQRSAADYVRAQIAYIRKDWPKLKAVGEIQGTQFEDTPYKASRLRVLKVSLQSLKSNPQPESVVTPFSSLLRMAHESILGILILLNILNVLVRWRIKRIGKINAQLQELMPRRIAA